jgi:Tfp pilus assembly protein PilN
VRAVNLLPRDEQRARVEGGRLPLVLLAVGAAAVTLAALVLGAEASVRAEERQARLDRVEAAIAELPRPPAAAVTQDTLAQERTNRLAALSVALGARVPFDRVLREISYVLPEDAWLTGLRAATAPSVQQAQGGSGSQAAVPGVTIQGATYSHDGVARLLARLALVPSLQDVRLTTSARLDPEPAPPPPSNGAPARAPRKKTPALVTFTISASLGPGGSR